MDDIILLNQILQDLHNGNIQMCYANTHNINRIVAHLLNNVKVVGPKDQDPNAEILGLLLRICNIVYNDTDNEMQVVEDGVYDLMVAMYRVHNDDTFQIGADVIHFKPMKDAIAFIQDEDPKMKEAIVFDSSLQDKIRESIFLEDLVYPNLMIRPSDFEQLSTTSQQQIEELDLISKRRHDTAHNHPELVGTLDKCKFVTCKEASDRGVLNDPNVQILERDFFAQHIKAGIIDPNKTYQMVCELKYDGVSVEADCTDIVVSARSRGDTGIGQATDMTPILQGYKFPHMVSTTRPLGVKFEAIIQKDDLRRFNEARGYNYKNGRTAIVGLTGSGDGWKYRDFITLVPLQIESEIFDSEDLQSNRIAEIEFLNDMFSSHACPLRYVVIEGTYIELLYQIKLFLEDAEFARPYIPFMYDGIVVSYLDPTIRKTLGRQNFINKYSMAVKFNPLKKYTTFRGYTYTVGQDGSITPMIHYDPVEFYGTIHPKSSGHSYKRFKELNLAIGDIICSEYVNDVMPYVTKPFNDWNEGGNPAPKEQFPTHCPICGRMLQVSPSGKSVRCINTKCGGRAISRMVNMFSKLNLAEFGEVTIQRLGKEHLYEIIDIAKEHRFQDYGFGPGESAILESEIQKLFDNPIKDYDLFGALGFTSMASKTWALIFNKYDVQDFYVRMRAASELDSLSNFMENELLTIHGLGKVTVQTILNEWDYFAYDILYCMHNMNIESTKGVVLGKQIRATGFRDKELFETLRRRGFDADDNGSVTNSTAILLIPHEGFESTKTAKAPESCMIIPIKEFLNNMNLYLQ